MKILSTIADVRLFIRDMKLQGLRIGFVPTMGDLHDGHLALVRSAKKNTDITIVSIFVNPTQFGPAEDYKKYQRNLENDSILCNAEGVDVIFAPSVKEIYPAGNSVTVNESVLSKNLCGRIRTGHFSGVLTVVAKLFNIIQPDSAFFGQKDAQQVRIIEQMIRDLNYDIEMVVVPTVRDRDGLALSSRNSYLTSEQRAWAPRIYKSLQCAKDMYNNGTVVVLSLRNSVKKMLIGDGIDVDYIEFVDWESLELVEKADANTLLAVAVKVGAARLIDNIFLGRTLV